MSIGREAIYAALFTLAKTATGVTTSGRKWRNVSDVKSAEMPALFQTQLGESIEQTKGLPAIYTLNCDLYLYAQTSPMVGGDAVLASTQINTMLDALQDALAPDPATDTQTLGGLVSHCWMNGKTQIEEGPLGDRAWCAVGVSIKVADGSYNLHSFDSGLLFFQNPGQDPIQVGALQGVDVTVSFNNNVERGNFQWPIKIMNKSVDLSGKARFAQINGAVLSTIIFGNPVTTGATLLNVSTQVIPSTPYRITPTVPGGGTWSQLLTVTYDSGASAGTPLTRVPSGPTVGQYSVAAGVYQFAAADAGKSVTISFMYTVTTGNSTAVANAYQGPADTFSLVLNSQGKDGQVTWVLNNVRSDVLNYATRLETFTIPEFTFGAQADASNNIGTMSYTK